MQPDGEPLTGDDAEVFHQVTVHSLTWLTLGNGVGLLLATLLLMPRLGELLVPVTYGRLMPLHLDLQLYGWASLPLVGLLLRIYRPPAAAARFALGAWSTSLALGAVSWLGGQVSGKLFLDWTGPARIVLVASMGFLALTRADGYRRQLARRPAAGGLLTRGALLVALFAVPGVLYWAANPEVYPPINPQSGGATGGSLLGSSLAIVALFVAMPLLLGLRPSDGGRVDRRVGVALALHLLAFALLDHGDRSNHELSQILALVSLGIWPPLLVCHLRSFRWPPASRRWLLAFAVWGIALYLDGAVSFLPGMLERLKFTNAMVAHAHIAMAGMVTCWNVVLLQCLSAREDAHDPFADRPAFWLWQAGQGVMVVTLLGIGGLEAIDPGVLFRQLTVVDVLYAGRWGGGAMMLAASARWLRLALAPRLHTATVPTTG